MKTLLLFVFVLINTLTFSQNNDSLTHDEKVYNDLMNFAPINFQPDTCEFGKYLKYYRINLSTLVSLRYFYQLRRKELNDSYLKALENRIELFAHALYEDGKKILISSIGGYYGCTGNMLDTIQLNNIQIINLKFCHSCMDADKDTRFIKLFNDKMYSLMNIKPPNKLTHYLNGVFEGRKNTKLVLRIDRTYQYRKRHHLEYTEGFWYNTGDTLVLKPNSLLERETTQNISTKEDVILFKFQSKKNKLISLEPKKIRLKKTK